MPWKIEGPKKFGFTSIVNIKLQSAKKKSPRQMIAEGLVTQDFRVERQIATGLAASGWRTTTSPIKTLC